MMQKAYRCPVKGLVEGLALQVALEAQLFAFVCFLDPIQDFHRQATGQAKRDEVRGVRNVVVWQVTALAFDLQPSERKRGPVEGMGEVFEQHFHMKVLRQVGGHEETLEVVAGLFVMTGIAQGFLGAAQGLGRG